MCDVTSNIFLPGDLLVSYSSTHEFRLISRSRLLSTSRRSSVRFLLISRCRSLFRALSPSLLFFISRSLCSSVSRSSSVPLLLNSRSLCTSTSRSSSVLSLLVSRRCLTSLRAALRFCFVSFPFDVHGLLLSSSGFAPLSSFFQVSCNFDCNLNQNLSL